MFHFEVFEFIKSPKYIKTHKVAKPGERELKIKALFESGMTLKEIGNKQIPPISRERVRQILKKYFGMVKVDGGSFVKRTPILINAAIEKERKRKEAIITRYRNCFGCTEEEFILINGGHWTTGEKKKCPATAYYYQRNNAGKRGIAWNITFPEWWKIWEESGKWHLRGKGKGYCMTRIGDTGGYEVGNVEIKTIGQNFSESYYKHPQAARREKAIAKGYKVIGIKKTHCKRGHELTDDNVYVYAYGRACKTCCKQRSLAYSRNKVSQNRE